MSILSFTRSGVYEIRNIQNGHRYIGSAVNIYRRWKTHRSDLCRNKHHSAHLQRAWDKYGEECFEFSVVEYCDISQLIQREQKYIDNWRPEYNCSPTAGSPKGVKHSEETRLKRKGLQAGSKNGMFGRSHSEEARKSISEKKRGVPMPRAAVEKIKKTLRQRFERLGHGKLGKKQKQRTSKYFGVTFYLMDGKYPCWQVRLTVSRKRVYLGQYQDEIVAARVYDQYVLGNNLPYPLNFGRRQ
jgi:group I intron endonuclease